MQETKEKKDKFEEKISLGEMSENEKEMFMELMYEYKDIFEYDEEKIGRFEGVKHKIRTQENQVPVRQKRYKESIDKTKFIREEVDNLIKMGKIRKSESPWASPVTLAGKKSGKYRFCIDYRKLNRITIDDAYPLPRMDELLERYEKAKWFTSLDLASGYHQIEMAEEDKEKTAFICSKGLYEYNVMPFGLKNAPGTFQRVMDEILKECMDDDYVVVYLDDIMIYSESFKEHIRHVEEVLRRIRKASLILKLKKCKFGSDKIEFLGHEIGRNGIKPGELKVKKIKDMERPKTVKDVRSFVMLCSYYRKFVKDFSKISKPLTELVKKDVKFEWTNKQEEAFRKLKEKLTSYPILRHPDMERKFILMTDASREGLGAVLAQLDDNSKEYVVAYASRSLRGAEASYPITDLECLGVIWAVQHFHKFLIGRKFTIVTDHKPLEEMMNVRKIPKGRRGKWIMELQQYDPEIKYKSGKQNKNADALSRIIDKEKDIKRADFETGKQKVKMNQKLQFVRINEEWISLKNAKGQKWNEIKRFTLKEASLLNLEEKTKREIMRGIKKEKVPQLIIIDGVDGVGKSTVVENLIREFRKEGLKVTFNTFKRRRNDDERFKEPTVKYEWLFRKQVVEQINRRMIEWDDEDIVILDKSPYCEYFYQKTQSFDRGLITPYGNYKMEEEIFKYKELIDNAIVIFLENKECWKNYIGRETKKSNDGHKASYETLRKEEYMDMVEMFRKYQGIYESTRKYDSVEISNDKESWKKVYKGIKSFLENDDY